MNVTICTPWRDAHELTTGYWRAIEAGLTDGDRVLVVDNGSDPPLYHDYLNRTGHGLPDYASILRSSANLGFSKACNAAFERVATSAVVFLNNDVAMTDPGWCQRLKKALRPGVLVGAVLRSGPHTIVARDEIPYLDGWCLAAMCSTWKELGGWDELEEPSYWGDNILSLRARAASIDLVTVTDLGLSHLENYTSRRMDVTGVSERNRREYIRVAHQLGFAGAVAA